MKISRDVIGPRNFESGFESESTLFSLNPNPDSYFQALNPNPNPAQKALNPDSNPNPDSDSHITGMNHTNNLGQCTMTGLVGQCTQDLALGQDHDLVLTIAGVNRFLFDYNQDMVFGGFCTINGYPFEK